MKVRSRMHQLWMSHECEQYNEWANQQQYEILFHVWQKILSIIKCRSCAILKYYRTQCGLYWPLVTFSKNMEKVDPIGKAQVILEAVYNNLLHTYNLLHTFIIIFTIFSLFTICSTLLWFAPYLYIFLHTFIINTQNCKIVEIIIKVWNKLYKWQAIVKGRSKL